MSKAKWEISLAAFFLGGEYTKLGFFILNVEHPNDAKNLSIVAIYKGADSAPNLALCNEVFEQLKAIHGIGCTFETSRGAIDVTLSL